MILNGVKFLNLVLHFLFLDVLQDHPKLELRLVVVTTRSSYNLIAIIGDIEISNPGFGYTTGDTAKIIGGGADIELEITNGGISGVNVLNSGMGFNSIPEVQINTNTGYNARLTPVLSFIRGRSCR